MQRDRLIYFSLALAVLAVYWPVCWYGFVALDDLKYVRDNAYVSNGFTWPNFVHAWTGVTQGNWHPLTMLSHMLDCQLFGVGRPGLHHLVNLVLHIVNTLLLFRVLRVMTEAVWPSGLVAALFGLHPLHVESVAWISERKDVLSTFFFLLTLLAYHAYARRPNGLRYLVVFAMLLLGLLSKPMLVTAPFVLLLLDFWPLGRWRPFQPAPVEGLKLYTEQGRDQEDVEADADDEPADIVRMERPKPLDDDSERDDHQRDEPHDNEPSSQEVGEAYEDADESIAELSRTPQLPERSLSALIVEKLPLLFLSILFSVIAYIVQQEGGAMNMLGELPWYVRLGNAVTAYGSYLAKTGFPYPLAAIYPYMLPKVVDSVILGAALIALTMASFRMVRTRPYMIVGLLWFLGTLVPVIGLVQVGSQSMADRYTYIPLVGIFVIVAWGGREFFDPWPVSYRITVSLAMLAIYSVVTVLQIGSWHDSEALFRRATAVPRNYRAHDGLGQMLFESDRVEEATAELEAAAKIAESEPTFRKLGLVLAVRGKYADARTAFEKAIKLQPSQPQPYRHLAWMLATAPEPQIRDGRAAVRLAQKAISLDKTADALYGDTLAAAYAENRQFDKAVAAAQAAAAAARKRGERELAAEIDDRCKLYEQHMPYHHLITKPRRL
jgi:hypothetical protein